MYRYSLSKKIIALFLIFISVSFLSMAQNKLSGDNINPDLFSNLRYRNIGPSRGGRVTTVTGIASRQSTFYMGSCGGGVWKTTDYGRSWRNVSDGYFTTGSIGAIRVAESNPDIVFVGTGSDGIRSNVITGRGVFKSDDAGKSWSFIGLRDVGQIGAVEIHPKNPDIVFVAAIGHAFGPNPDRGVYRTLNGGENWEKVLFISDSTGAVDLEFCPDNPQEIYASMWRAERKPWTIISGSTEGGIYKSADGGNNWNKLTNNLPNGLFGKSDLAVSPNDPNRLYVLIEAPVGEGGLYRSDDRGKSFELVTTQANLLDRPFYYLNLNADPTNADILYANSTGYYKSTDAGKTWRRQSTPHGDNHDMWINPEDPDIFIQSNDGGANVTIDGGNTWSTQRNQPTAELYQVAVDDQFPYWVYAGQQDNSTIMVPSLPPYSPGAGATGFWRAIGGCETGPAIPKPGNHNIVYSNCKGRFGRYNKLTGEEKQYYVGAANIYGHNPRDLKYRFQRVSPIHISPHDPDVVYHASQYLHKTTDEGVTWETISPDLTANDPSKQVISGSPITRDITGEEFYSTIYAVQESPIEKGLIWVGASDGPFHVTRDGGKTWTNITPDNLPPGGRVQNIEASPHNAGKVYYAVHRYLLDDWHPYIYCSEDYGKSWTLLTSGDNGIPVDYPTRVVREDPDREGLLYAGTEFGMFISFDEGENWTSFQLNLPVTPVTDIKVYRQDLVLSTMGRSFWILDNISSLHQIKSDLVKSDFLLLEPRDAYRMRFRSYGRSAADPEYPSPGVSIDYYLNKEISEEIKLEILDEEGNLIRVFSNQQGIDTFSVPDNFIIPYSDLLSGSNRLANEKGMHRFTWDLRYPSAWNPNPRRAQRGGIMATPGKYTAKLTLGQVTQKQEFNLLIDPRIKEDGVTQADLVEQFDISIKVRDALSLAQIAAARVKNTQDNISKKSSRLNKINNQLSDILDQLVTARGRYPTPKLIDQLNYLLSMLSRADQKPGKDAYIRYEELINQLHNIIKDLDDILAKAN